MAVEGTAAAPSPTDAAWRRLFRVTGIAGLAATVLIFVAVLVGTRTEPTFNATATEVLAYYRSPNTPGADFRSFVLTVGLIAFVWFVVALTTMSTGRLSRTAPGHDDGKPIATCGSSALSEGLWIPTPLSRCGQPPGSTLPEKGELGS